MAMGSGALHIYAELNDGWGGLFHRPDFVVIQYQYIYHYGGVSYDMYFFGGTFETYSGKATSPAGTWTDSSYAATSYGEKFWVNGHYCCSMIYQKGRGKNMPYRLGLEGSTAANINCQYKEGSIGAEGYSFYRPILFPDLLFDPEDGLILAGGTNVRLNDIYFDGNYFGVVGNNGYIFSTIFSFSSSGIRNSGTTENLRGIAYGNGT
ncbi:MAG: hypothetical protein LBE98_00620 [Puniceicoccales bacterium]|jgi:hypothetical protein|nr:hypothetical protein [Puniceicoccales bacterium]